MFWNEAGIENDFAFLPIFGSKKKMRCTNHATFWSPRNGFLLQQFLLLGECQATTATTTTPTPRMLQGFRA